MELEEEAMDKGFNTIQKRRIYGKENIVGNFSYLNLVRWSPCIFMIENVLKITSKIIQR